METLSLACSRPATLYLLLLVLSAPFMRRGRLAAFRIGVVCAVGVAVWGLAEQLLRHTAVSFADLFSPALGLAGAAAGWRVLKSGTIRDGHAPGILLACLVVAPGWALHSVRSMHFGWRELAISSPLTYIALVSIASAGLAVVSSSLVGGFRPLKATLAIAASLLTPAWCAYAKPSSLEPERVIVGSAPDPAHVILLTIDTLRADNVSAILGRAPETPAIDQLAFDGVLFRRAIAPAPWTVPSFMSLMTGLSPLVHRSGLDSYDASRCPAELPTLGTILSEAGYYSGALVGNYILGRDLNVADGFSEYSLFNAAYTLGTTKSAESLMHSKPDRYVSGGITRQLTDSAIQWVRRKSGEPFFLWLHYFDPHQVYAPPVEQVAGLPSVGKFGFFLPSEDFGRIAQGVLRLTDEKRQWVRELYNEEVSYVDNEVGRFLSSLRDEGVYDDSLIVLTSDHGEEFWEHGGVEHGHTLYNELLHVPLIIKSPGSRAGRGVVDAFVPTEAVFQTIAELTGAGQPATLGQAASLTALLEDVSLPYKEPILAAGNRRGDQREALILGRYKLISETRDEKEELFDLRSDPLEQEPIPLAEDEIREHLRNVLAARRAQADVTRNQLGLGSTTQRIDEEMLDRLKSLGYL